MTTHSCRLLSPPVCGRWYFVRQPQQSPAALLGGSTIISHLCEPSDGLSSFPTGPAVCSPNGGQSDHFTIMSVLSSELLSDCPLLWGRYSPTALHFPGVWPCLPSKPFLSTSPHTPATGPSQGCGVAASSITIKRVFMTVYKGKYNLG